MMTLATFETSAFYWPRNNEENKEQSVDCFPTNAHRHFLYNSLAFESFIFRQSNFYSFDLQGRKLNEKFISIDSAHSTPAKFISSLRPSD